MNYTKRRMNDFNVHGYQVRAGGSALPHVLPDAAPALLVVHRDAAPTDADRNFL
jgi:hypothetical protein